MSATTEATTAGASTLVRSPRSDHQRWAGAGTTLRAVDDGMVETVVTGFLSSKRTLYHRPGRAPVEPNAGRDRGQRRWSSRRSRNRWSGRRSRPLVEPPEPL